MPRRTAATNIRLDDTITVDSTAAATFGPGPSARRARRSQVLRDRAERWQLGVVFLAVAAFVPMLASRPGRLILDTSDRLHLDPGDALTSAAARWDRIGSLGVLADKTYDHTFPMSPVFWFGDRIGLPMWVTHRLWLGLLLFAAGTGVLFLLRTMSWNGRGWLLGALTYQCSPYVLLYAGTRSTVLLTWAALPWLIAFTMRSLVESGWRSPASCAVVVALVGAGNIPATLYVALACLAWVLYATIATKDVEWRRALRAFARIVSLCTIVSIWWITRLLTNPGAVFADIRANDPLDAVQASSPVSEVVRGFGSWRLYTLDPSNAIAAGADLQRSPWLIAVGFALPAIAVATLVRVRFPYRLYFVTLFALGAVLSTGTYATDDPEPSAHLLRVIVEHGPGALLSPTSRALPLFWLAVSVSVAVGVHRFILVAPRTTDTARFGVALLILLGTLPLFRGTALDGARAIADGVPQYWHDAADYVNGIDSSSNILELPALAQGTYTWGSPNQPISYALFDRPVGLTDPGSAPADGAATLLRELDLRIQRGELEPRDLTTVARLLSADTVVLRADGVGDAPRVDAVRALLATAPSIGPPRRFGTTADGDPAIEVYRVEGGAARISTIAADRLVVMSGSAAGVLDLVQAGIVDEELPLVVDEADLLAEDIDSSVPDLAPVALTDSERPVVTDRFARPGTEQDPDTSARTTIGWEGVAAIAALPADGDDPVDPEHRLVRAFDDDPATSWLTVGRSTPVGASINVLLDAPLTASSITIAQPAAEAARQVTTVRLVFDALDALVVELDATSSTRDGQTIVFPERTFRSLKIAIDDVAPDDAALPAGFSTLDMEGLDPTEVLRLPAGRQALDNRDSHPLVVSMTRWRAASPGAPPLETRFRRSFVVETPREMLVDVAVRGDPGSDCRSDLLTVNGEPVSLQVDNGQSSRLSDGLFAMQLCGEDPVSILAERNVVETTPPTDPPRQVTVERVVLHSEIGRDPSSLLVLAPPVVSTSRQTSATVKIPDASAPLWVVQAASVSRSWSAELDGDAVAAARRANGFASAWPITQPDGQEHEVKIRFKPQRAIDIAVIVSAAGFVLVLALALRPRRSSAAAPLQPPPGDPRRYVHPLVVVMVSLGVFGLTAGPLPGIIAGLTALLLEQRPHLFSRAAWLPSSLLLGAGVGRALWQAIEKPAIGPTWPAAAPVVDGIVWVALSMAVAMALANTDHRPSIRPPIRSRR
ncbi:MAG: alpha-(1-_3)-arabinofuranosyltransferase family protein [Acidimicrobiia bacterium]